ncbi:MAG TPA: type II toxin-antitoxin system RelE/ParE family toxin [Candidatus Acidoferrales bacterium]
MAVILKRPRALFDLAEIWSYVAEDSMINADRLAARIDKAFTLLARRPGLGRPRPELYPNLRSFVIRKYVVFYLAITHGIDVIRVLHGSRDIETVFEDAEQ